MTVTQAPSATPMLMRCGGHGGGVQGATARKFKARLPWLRARLMVTAAPITPGATPRAGADVHRMRKHYTEAARGAARLGTSEQASLRAAASRLGVAESTAYCWLRCVRRASPPVALVARHPIASRPSTVGPSFARLIRAADGDVGRMVVPGSPSALAAR